MLSRKAYLENEWSRYPTKPKAHDQAGQVVSCANGLLVLLTPASTKLELTVDLIWCERLRPYDWVSCLTENQKVMELCLLSPNLRGPAVAKVSAESLQLTGEWTEFLTHVRSFFRERSFYEIQTPTLVPCPGTEPFLDVFSTEFQMGQTRERLYLPTSPELHLKKALAMGVPKLFEVRPCFRNGEISATHQPEFWMLEWYQSFVNLGQIKQDLEELIRYLIEKMGLAINFAQPRTRSLRDLFGEFCGFHLKPETEAHELAELAHRLGLQLGSGGEQDLSFDDLFYFLFLEKIETKLEAWGPLYVEKYPPSQAALARLTTDGWGDRFEFYWQGFEIANAFHELNDPALQRQRAQEDLAKKVEVNKLAVSLDEEFFEALEGGMPPSAGIALGLERLFLAIKYFDRQKPDLGRLRLFPKKSN